MDKQCRACGAAYYPRSCPIIGIKRRAEVWPDEEDCYYRKPRKTPLLVDELADELCKAIEVIEAYAPNDPVRDSGNRAIERYHKEVGDGPA